LAIARHQHNAKYALPRWLSRPLEEPLALATAAFLLSCLALGGGTREGFLGDVVLQLLAVALLLWALARILDLPAGKSGPRRRGLVVVGIGALLLAFHAFQLVPLPPALWSLLPGRAGDLALLEAAGVEPIWRPISLAPHATWISATSLLPPLAVLLAVVQLDYEQRRWLALTVLGAGVASVFLGLLQVAQGPGSSLRFFAITNPTEAVGFFANRNHFSALLYCLLLMAAGWVVTAAGSLAAIDGKFSSTRAIPRIIGVMAAFAVVVVLIGGQAMARSRAGLGLTAVALVLALAMAYIRPSAVWGGAGETGDLQRRSTAKSTTRIIVAALLVGLLLATQFALMRLQDRFEADRLADARVPFARNTMEAARAYMPFGSGMGTFVSVYPGFEKAGDGTTGFYANRAHNDVLELWLEAGVAGLSAMVAFAIWLLWTLSRLWWRGLEGADPAEQLQARAATAGMLLLALHSLVDYPLRTAALMVLLAFFAASTISPLVVARKHATRTASDAPSKGQRTRVRSRDAEHAGLRMSANADHAGEHEGEPRAGASNPNVAPLAPGSVRPRRPFTPAKPRDDWPEAWRKPSGPGNEDPDRA
jgi:O-antigen ligase